MRNTLDVIRTVLAAAVGVAAMVAICFAFATYGHVGGLDPLALHARFGRGLVPYDIVLLVGAGLGLAWLHATWFDALLTGPAVVRGLKFGVITWAWCTGIALLLRECGLAQWVTSEPLHVGLVALVACSAFGVVLGVVYGAGRRYDEYRSGLAYGLPDRHTLI